MPSLPRPVQSRLRAMSCWWLYVDSIAIRHPDSNMSINSTKATSGRSKPSLESGTSDIPNPTPEASSEEVRAYLASLLISKRKVSDNDADRIVSPWRIGSGQEMRSYSPAMYLKVFGDEQGWILYREIQLAMSREQVKNQTLLQACWPCMFQPHIYIAREFE